jgi:hypothetical protein
MEALHKNIDALESMIELLIQKWLKELESNKTLNERIRELELELKTIRSDNNDQTELEPTRSNIKNKVEHFNIESVLDGYIEQIDKCLELINTELNGK